MTEQATTLKTFGNPPIPVEDVVDADGNTYCQIHTDTATGLRCNNCERLMCAKCAVHTPVGYRCEQCVRQFENRLFNADQSYYAILFGVCAVGGLIGGFLANLVGFFIFVFFIGAAAGGVISEFAMRFIKGKRGRYAGQVAAAGVVVGVMVMAMILAATTVNSIISTSEQQLIQEYGVAQAQEIIRQGQLELFPQIFFSYLTSLSVLIFTGVTAVTVYGRFNFYGGKRR